MLVDAQLMKHDFLWYLYLASSESASEAGDTLIATSGTNSVMVNKLKTLPVLWAYSLGQGLCVSTACTQALAYNYHTIVILRSL